MNKAELNKILDNHKLWLQTNGEQGERADLRYADLRSADLRYADLRSANLRSANLRSANLRSANLRSADLRSADLRSADLRYADLRYANLRSANLRYADLSYADLSSADLSYADLRSADLDYSSIPLSCRGLNVHIDDRLAIQQLYHLVRNVQYSKNTSAEMKKLCMLKSIVKKANEFHRVNECGKIEIKEKL